MIYKARARGLGIILVTHNPNHAYDIGDRFTILHHGASYGTVGKDEMSLDQMVTMMGVGNEGGQNQPRHFYRFE